MTVTRYLLLCFALSASAFAIDRNAFTFTNYDLNLRLEPEQQRLGVRGKIKLRNDSAAPQKVAVLQISSSLDWRSIRANGNPVQFISQVYTSDIDHTGSLSEAIVTLPQPVPPKASVELEIGYEGTIPLDTTRLQRLGVPEAEAKHTDWDQISPSFTAVRGVGYVVWYPVAMEAASLSEGSSVFETVGMWKERELAATMHVDVCLSGRDLPFVLMNNRVAGVPAGSLGAIAGGDSTSCGEHRFDPLVVTVPAFVLANFQHLENPLLDIYYFPEHKSAAERYGALTDKLAPFFSLWFGQARSRAKVVELPDPAAPFESGTTLLTPFSSDSGLAELTLAHQIAHASFFSQRPWIDEGIAHFAQALWREHVSGRQAALDYMGLHRTALADAEKSIIAQKNSASDHSLINTADDEFYRSKAMFVWWMLRDMIDDAALRRALAAYHPEEDKKPTYMQQLLETESKRDLAWFFEDWVYQDRGLPDFRVSSAYPRALDTGGFMTTVTVENLGAAAAEVPVTVNIEGGEVTKRLQVRGKGSASIRIETPSAPYEVVVNDGSVPESDLSNNTFKIQVK